MKTLVTGAKGFIGKNLCTALRRSGIDIAEIDIDCTPKDLMAGLTGADIVFHMAGVNRPQNEEEFQTGNVGSLDMLFSAIDHIAMADVNAVAPFVVFASSIQAEHNNPYGRSKLAAEKLLQTRCISTGLAAVIYRLPGVFGKWCNPNYNSVVATFCYNVARNLPITISDPSRTVDLVHVDDVVAQFMSHLESRPSGVTFGEVRPIFSATLGELAERIKAFRATRESLEVPDTSDPFNYRLLGTYTSYLSPDDLTYQMKKSADARGILAELLKSPHFGQIFVSRTHPGIIRGNHYHDLKVEKFCVLEGDAVIRFRSILSSEVTEHYVSGTDFKVVDIPPGMTHSIENIGSSELIVLFWASEILDLQHPDTYFSEVVHD